MCGVCALHVWCVCVCRCGHGSTQVFMCVHIHLWTYEDEVDMRCPPPLPLHFIFWNRFFHWNWGSPVTFTACPAIPADLPEKGSQTNDTAPIFLHGCWRDPRTGPPACVIKTLPADTSLQPHCPLTFNTPELSWRPSESWIPVPKGPETLSQGFWMRFLVSSQVFLK